MSEARHTDQVEQAAAQAVRDLLALRNQHERMIAGTDAFPAWVFPSAIADYITEASRMYNVPLSFLGSGVVGIAAAIAGTRCELAVKARHRERLSFWLPMIGPPGSSKSGAIDLVRPPLDRVQQRYAVAYSDELTQWDTLPKTEQRTTPRPMMRSIFTANATIEAVAQMAANSPGLAVISDELSSWIEMMGKYQAGGSNRSDWLTTWSGAALKNDRKMAGSVYVLRHCISVMGGIQPDLLPTLRKANGLDDGSVDRMLPVWPVPGLRRWVEDDISPALSARYIDQMLALEDLGTTDGPLVVTLGPAAKRVFIQWYDENNATNSDGFSMKADRHLNRLALLLHVLQYGRDANRPVSEATIADAITLFEFYRNEHNRMMIAIGAGLGGQSTNAEERLRSRVLGFLTDAGPDGLARTDIHNALRGNTSAEDITYILEGLADEGLATKTIIPTGRRPKELWTITPRSYVDTDISTATGTIRPIRKKDELDEAVIE